MMNVFNTEQEAIDAEAIDWQMFNNGRTCESFDACEHNGCLSVGNICGGYWRTTKRWANIQKRVDTDEWFYEVCPQGIQTHEQKEAEPSWYPAEGI